MVHNLIHPPKARPGERLAVLSPSFAAAGAFPAVHEQAMRRLTEVTGLIPVEYPTTRKVGASVRRRDLHAGTTWASPGLHGEPLACTEQKRMRGLRDTRQAPKEKP